MHQHGIVFYGECTNSAYSTEYCNSYYDSTNHPPETFAKSIKKDPESYPMFKEARFWDTWNRELTSKAHLHDLSNVLDPDYVPTMAEENELFEL